MQNISKKEAKICFLLAMLIAENFYFILLQFYQMLCGLPTKVKKIWHGQLSISPYSMIYPLSPWISPSKKEYAREETVNALSFYLHAHWDWFEIQMVIAKAIHFCIPYKIVNF